MSSTTYKCYLNGVRVGLTVRIIDYEHYMLKVNFFVMRGSRVQIPLPAPEKSTSEEVLFSIMFWEDSSIMKNLKIQYLIISLFILLFSSAANAEEICNVKFNITAPTADTTATVIIAEYGNDILSSVSLENVEIKAGQTEVRAEAVNGARVMLWDSITSMKPLAPAVIADNTYVSGTMLVCEDFSAVTDSWGFSGNAGAVIEDGALSLCDDTIAGKTYTTVKNMEDKVSAEDALKIKFDWSSDVEAGKDRSSGLELRDSDGKLLFAMFGKGANKAESGIKYAISETDDTINWNYIEAHTSGKLYTIEIEANFVKKTIQGTISETESGNVLVTIPETAVEADNFSQMTALNYYSTAPMTLDNVVIKSLDKYKTLFTVKGNADSTPIGNIEISFGENSVVTDENGKAELMLPVGEYAYTITATQHKIYKGTVKAGETANVNLEYAGESVPTSVVISGGDEGIYKPKTGSNSTENSYTAVVYDQIGQPMDSEDVEWSIIAEDGASIDENNIITVTDEFPVADDNGETVVVKATLKSNPEIYAVAELHVYNTARAESFDIIGPSAIKDGLSVTYTIGNVKDQYGVDYTGDATYTLSASENVTVEGMTVTPNTGTVQTSDFILTANASDSDKTSTKTVTAYAFDFYESQIGGSYYGDVRTAEIDEATYTVWPSSSAANVTQTITLPEPVEMLPGTSKLITYSTAWTTQTVYAQKRYITFDFTGETDISISYQSNVALLAGGAIESDIQIGKQGDKEVFEETLIRIKTDAFGISTADISYAGGEVITVELGSDIGTLTSIGMYGGKGSPDERLLAIKDIKICNSDIPDVEILGSDVIAKVENSVVSKQYNASVFVMADGEEFAWSVTDSDGNAIDGVSIDENGVLTVADSVSADTVAVISYTSNLNASKSASKAVTIKDFANIDSFTINGATTVEAGKNAKYSVSDIIDEYGNNTVMIPTYAITSGSDIAEIDAETGVLTTYADKTGNVTVSVTLGNTGKKKTLTKEVTIGKYTATGETSEESVAVNVAELANYSADTMYRVTTATNDGKMVSQYETSHTNGIVTVDMTGADKYEVSPIYKYTNVGDVRYGYEIFIPNGYYDFTFTKGASPRADILVNGDIVGQNVDQVGKHRTSKNTVYEAKDVKVSGGEAVVLLKDNPYLSEITVKKAPSILQRKTHIYFAGDSTHCSYHGNFSDDVEIINGLPRAGYAQTGWAQVLDKFLDEDVNITNLAESGNYAYAWYNSYFKGGVINQAEAGDYFIAVFGYNDKAKSSLADMKRALETMVDECREKGIIPIIVSSQRAPAVWPGEESGYLEFFEVSKTVAKEKDTLFVDMTDISGEYFEEVGRDFVVQNVHIYSNGASQDKIHLSYFGAMKMAEMFVQNVSEQQESGITTALGESFEKLTVNKEAEYTFTMVDDSTVTLKIEK